MAVNNPPIALHNAGATHTAQALRFASTSGMSGARAVSSLTVRGGFDPFLGTGMAATELPAPAMGVRVGIGVVTVPGTENTSQGAYTVVAPTVTDVNLTAAHASLSRIDTIAIKIEDSFYSGANNTASIVAVTGTAGSGVAPTLPANALAICDVTIPALDTIITNAQITDRRIFNSVGYILATSTNMPSVALTNMLVLQTDTGHLVRWDGAAWVKPYSPAWVDYSPLVYTTSSTTPASISRTIGYAKYRRVDNIVDVLFQITVNATTTGGVSVQMPFTATYRNLNAGTLWILASGGAPAGQGGIAAFISAPHQDKITATTLSNAFADVTASAQALRGQVRYEPV